jgi:hypothetical protein
MFLFDGIHAINGSGPLTTDRSRPTTSVPVNGPAAAVRQLRANRVTDTLLHFAACVCHLRSHSADNSPPSLRTISTRRMALHPSAWSPAFAQGGTRENPASAAGKGDGSATLCASATRPGIQSECFPANLTHQFHSFNPLPKARPIWRRATHGRPCLQRRVKRQETCPTPRRSGRLARDFEATGSASAKKERRPPLPGSGRPPTPQASAQSFNTLSMFL